MAADAVPGTSQGYTNDIRITKTSRMGRRPTIREVLMQLECHHYKSFEHRVSLLIASWKCLSENYSYFHDVQNIFEFIYRESARSILSGAWVSIDQHFKRGLARAIIQFSQVQDCQIECSGTLCSSLIMTIYDPWGDPGLCQIVVNKDIHNKRGSDFVESEPADLLLVRVECLVAAGLEESAACLCRVCLKSENFSSKTLLSKSTIPNVKQPFMENLLRILFRKGKLNEIIADSSLFTCLDAVDLVRQVQNSSWPESDALAETLINLFLVHDLLSQTSYCCTKELMRLWCELQVRMQRSVEEVQAGAHKLIVPHASSSAHFYVFVDTLWEQFGLSLLPLYLELFVRGLTSDLNFLEAARQADAKESIIEIENHMATVYFKLSTLFTDVSKEISLECLLSSFSLDPSKEKLDLIKALSLQISVEKSRKSLTSNTAMNRSKKSQKGHGMWTSSGSCIPMKKVPKVMCDRGIQVGESPPNMCHLFRTAVNTYGETQVVESPTSPSQSPENGCTIPEHVSSDSGLSSVEGMYCDEVSDLVESLLNKCVSLSAKVSDCEAGMMDPIAESGASSDRIESSKDCGVSSHSEKSEVDSSDKNGIYSKEDSVMDRDTTGKPIVNGFKTEPECNDSPELKAVVKVILDCIINVVSGDVKLMLGCQMRSAKNDYTSVDSLSLPLSCPKSNNLVNDDVVLANGPLVNGSLEDEEVEKTFHRGKSNLCNNTYDISDERTLERHDGLYVGISENEKPVGSPDTFNKSDHNMGSKVIQAVTQENCCIEKDVLATLPDCGKFELSGGILPVSSNEGIVQSFACSKAGYQASEKDGCLDLSDVRKMPLEIKEHAGCDQVASHNKHITHHGYSFQHVIMDCKIPGVTSQLLSDFIIVLESLRSQQLQSTGKWAEIKEACRDYLDTVSSMRCMFLNTQLNGSAGSEDESVSEPTQRGHRDFASFKSDSSNHNDSYVDKTLLLRRFINGETDPKFTTFVTLSDIQHPYLRLDRLLCADASSSHHEHAKHHRRRREKSRDPKKVALRHLRHGSGYSHDVVKRKKKKKRKGRKEKSHTKKHHSSHNKDRDFLLNKKKRQRSKKKKDSQLDATPGEYFSDFSSTELMRIVKEHSNSFSQGGLSYTQKRKPLSAGSSGDFNSACNFPLKKKQKQVSFKKLKDKKNSLVKSHDKHMHRKSKRDKKKSLSHSQDYSRIVEFSSVKQMQAVQIRQSSMSLDLGNVNKDGADGTVNCENIPSDSRSRDQNPNTLETCNQEDIKKFQMLLSANQPSSDTTAEQPYQDNVMISSNKQTVLKYVSSKTTSRLLSVAQASNHVFQQKGDSSSSPTPMASTSYVPPNGNYVLTDRNGVPIPSSGTGQVVASPLPGYVTAAAARSSSSSVSNPVITAFTFPVTQAVPNNSGSKFVAGKLVIPLGNCSSISSGTTLEGNQNVNSVVVSSGSSMYCTPNLIIVKKSNSGSHMMPVHQSIQRVVPAVVSSTISRMPLSSLPNRKSSLSVNKALPNTARKLVKKYIQPTSTKKPTSLSSVNSSRALPLPVKLGISSMNSGSANSSSSTKLLQKTHSSTTKPIVVAACPQTSEERPETTKTISGNSAAAASDAALAAEEDKEDVVPDSVQAGNDNDLQDQESKKLSEPASEVSDILPDAPVDSIVMQGDVDGSDDMHGTILADDEYRPSTEDVAPSEEVPQETSAVQESKEFVKEKEVPDEEELSELPKTVEEEEEEDDDIVPGSARDHPSEDAENSVAPTGENHEESTSFEENVESPERPASPASVPDSAPSSPKSPAEDSTEKDELSSVILPSSASPPSEDTGASVPIIGSSTVVAVMSAAAASPEKQLQPLLVVTASAIGAGSKLEGVSQSEAPTRSLTSISDAVRFSLMDMDDATGSVENQVLQTFHPSFSQDAVAYANQQSTVSVSETSITTLTSSGNLVATGGPAQTFSANSLQNDSYAECHSTSTAAEWSTDELVTNVISSKSLENEGTTSSDQKEEEKVKKKRKKKEKVERDPESIQRYWCEICHRGFFSAYNLRRHCRNVHKMDLPKGTSDVPFTTASTQCLTQVGDRVICSSVTDAGAQPSAAAVVPPVGSSSKSQEFLLQSPTADGKSKDFGHQASPSSHPKQSQLQVAQALNQSSNYTLHSPPRSAAQTQTTVQVSSITPQKDFHLQASPPTSIGQGQQSSFVPVAAPLPKPVPKFQMIQAAHPPAQAHAVPRMGMHQSAVSLPSPAVQATRLVQPGGALQKPPAELQQAGVVQPLQCQVQQIQQSIQCPLAQSKEAEQRASMLQSAAQEQAIRIARHTAEVQQAQKTMQQFKKTALNQSLQKSDPLQPASPQVQQVGAVSHLQPPILNPQMKKLVQIRQAALGRPPEFALQLPTQTATVDLHGSQLKAPLQYFQPQVSSPQHQSALHSAVRQTLVSCTTARPNQANLNYVGQAVQNVSNAEFLSRIVPHSGQERSSCSQTFAGITTADISLVSGQAHVPIIRQSAETNEGLEDLEQFLLENMPWGGASGEQLVSQVHSLNRTNSDAVALASPIKATMSVGGGSGVMQAKLGQQNRNKQTITKPKACKPSVPVASKNIVNKSCAVKKKACPKKVPEPMGTGCVGPAKNMTSGAVPEAKQYEQHKALETHSPHKVGTNLAPGTREPTVEENDSHSSDSVQCIEIMHHGGASKTNRAIDFNAAQKQQKPVAVCKQPGFCSPAVSAAEQIAAQSAVNCTQTNLPVAPAQPGSIHFPTGATVPANPLSKVSPPRSKEQHTFRYGDSASVFLNPPCQSNKTGCTSGGQCSSPLKTVQQEPATKQPDSSLGCLPEDCAPVYPEMPSFYAGAMVGNDNEDAEKELRNLQNKISDCEKHLQNSESMEARNVGNSDVIGDSGSICDGHSADKAASQPNATGSSVVGNGCVQKIPFLGNKDQESNAAEKTVPAPESRNETLVQTPKIPTESGQLHFLDEKPKGEKSSKSNTSQDQPSSSSQVPVKNADPGSNRDSFDSVLHSNTNGTKENHQQQQQCNSSVASSIARNSHVDKVSILPQNSPSRSERPVTGANATANNDAFLKSFSSENEVVAASGSEMPSAKAVTISIPENTDPPLNRNTSNSTFLKDAVTVQLETTCSDSSSVNTNSLEHTENVSEVQRKELQFQKPETRYKSSVNGTDGYWHGSNAAANVDLNGKNGADDGVVPNSNYVNSGDRKTDDSRYHNDFSRSNKNNGNSLSGECDSHTDTNNAAPTRRVDSELQTGAVTTSRTRLRDTPKTSVKRSCPCCTESCAPKKCRESSGGGGGGNVPSLLVNKVLKVNQPKPSSPQRTKVVAQLKAKTNNASVPSVQVKTRSSHRLRSRNSSVT